MKNPTELYGYEITRWFKAGTGDLPDQTIRIFRHATICEMSFPKDGKKDFHYVMNSIHYPKTDLLTFGYVERPLTDEDLGL